MTTRNPGRNVPREGGGYAAGKAWGAGTPGLGRMDMAGEGLQQEWEAGKWSFVTKRAGKLGESWGGI